MCLTVSQECYTVTIRQWPYLPNHVESLGISRVFTVYSMFDCCMAHPSKKTYPVHRRTNKQKLVKRLSIVLKISLGENLYFVLQQYLSNILWSQVFLITFLKRKCCVCRFKLIILHLNINALLMFVCSHLQESNLV